MMAPTANLIVAKWLWREFDVTLQGSDRKYRVVYYGRGIGYEAVYVDKVLTFRKTSWQILIPLLDFRIGDVEASISVKPSWWMMGISDFSLTVDGMIVYREGKEFGGNCPGCDYNLQGNISGTCPECGRRVAVNMPHK